MNRKITVETATKLQNILSKHMGRMLSEEELAQAYYTLMDFAFALVGLTASELQSTTISPQETIDNSKYITV